MTLREAIAYLSARACPDAAASARALFRHTDGTPDRELYGGNPEGSPLADAAVRRRAAGEPLAYLLGYTDFYRERYRVTPSVLIPRPETEELVDYAVHHLRTNGQLLDLCTGSGCVGLSTLANTKGTAGVLVDLSADALSVAEDNARAFGLLPRVTLRRANVLTERIEGVFDAVLSNPPYVNDDVYPTLPQEIRHEPRMAFVGGADGMDFYRAIVRDYHDRLTDGGFIALEIGYDQGERIRALADAFGMRADILRDLASHERVAVLRR